MTTFRKLFPKKGNLIAFAFVAAFLFTSFGSMFMPLTGLYKPEPIGAFLNGNIPTTTPANGGGPVNWSVVPAFPNLTFNNPLVMTMYPDPSVDVMFVASRLGTIEYFDASNPNVNSKTLMADFTAETTVSHDGGFLGMAFHPDFASNPNRKWVYLFYVASGPHVFSGQSQPNNGPFSCDCECFSCATDGRWYGSYLRLARYDVTGSLAGGLSIDKSSEKRMINIPMFNATHRGGGLVFGDDGYLYVTVGDQARRTTAQELTKASDNSQGINMFEGGVLRLDVNVDAPSPNSHAPTYVLGPQSNFPMRDYDNNCSGGSDPITYVTTETVTGAFYRIPNDNPQWYTGTSNYFEEFLSVGHRAPHRMTKDRLTGNLWIGEVGAGSREEINALTPDLLKRNGATTQGGGNGGWPKHEGYLVGNFTACGSNNLTLSLGTYFDPVVDFPRSGAKGANAIIGGYVYRGSKFASHLGGKYICGGYSQNRIFAIDWKTDGSGKVVPDFPSGGNYRDAITELTSFTPGQMITWGEDHDGELYIGKIGNNVNLYTLSATGIGNPAPQYLSQTGAFSDLVNMVPSAGVLPYDLIEPFWSDNAKKTRWIAVPNDGAHDTAAEKIVFSADDSWQYPAGTVLIKHFEMETSPGVFQKLETRLEVLGTDGNFYYLTYKWNAGGTDAQLLEGGLDETLTVNGQSQVWHYPSTSECQTCHQTAVGSVLGPNTRNLNRDRLYGKTGVTANQLLTMSHLGIFDQTLTEADVNAFLTLAAKDDEEASLEFRARSYLDVNCGYCHQPATGNRANFDARMATPLQSQNLVNGAVMDNLGIPGATYIFPQSVAQSIIHHRMDVLTEGIAMPPLAKNKVDDAGVQLIADWINALQPSPPPPSQPGLLGNYHNGMTLQDERFTQIDANVNFDWGNGSPDATEVGTDQFSVRWTGLVRPQYSETYTFYTNSDDGVRLWINGQLIIDNWTDHAPTENSGTITLNAEEEVSLVLEFYENGGGAVIQLSWSSASRTKQIIPAGRLSHIPAGNSGPCSGGGGTQTIIAAGFDSNSEGWTYVDDAFRNTNQGSYATGQYQSSGGNSGGGLDVVVGNVNGDDISNMSGGWEYTFNLIHPGDVSIAFDYNMSFPSPYESDEYGQVLMSFDNTLYGTGANDYIAQFNGTGSNQSTGWQTYALNLTGVASGTHTLRIGGFNSKKTTADEYTTILIDNVNVTAPGGNNTAPVAIFRATPTSGGFPLLVTADASASYDPNGDPVTMSWDFGDGQSGSGEQVSHSYTSPGSYNLELTVTDNQGCEDTETILITVLNNGIPTVSLSATPTTGEAPLVVLFEATVSDPESDPLTYQWEFGDGTHRTGLTPGATHTYNYPGIYEVTLTVNDGFTNIKVTETITVLESYSDLGIFLKNMDVGTVLAAGNSNHLTGEYTVQGSGQDIGITEDGFQYIYRPYQRYGEIVARVSDLTNTNDWAKSGLMFRESTAAGAPFVYLLVRPDNQVALQWREASVAPDNIAQTEGPVGGTAQVKYLRLVRLDNCFTAFYSTVGVDGPWTQVGTDLMISMPEEALVGLAVTSHFDGTLATGTFDQVRLRSLQGIENVVVKAKVMLQGAWAGSEMQTALRDNALIPMDQPYGAPIGTYGGNEGINSYPPNIVDWVLVQIRDEADHNCILAQRACFVRDDGYLIDLDGTEGVDFGAMEVDRGYVSIVHRNHLGVMTEGAVDLK